MKHHAAAKTPAKIEKKETTETETVCTVNAAYGDPNPAGLPVSIGVPFPKGMLNDPAAMAVRSPSGERRPAAGRVLARHADGSIRWCLVSFGACEAGPHDVQVGQAAPAPEPAIRPGSWQAVVLRHNGGDWTLDNGRLRLTVCETGPGVLGTLVCDGHPYLASPADLRFAVDDASTLSETRRTVRVIEQSPLRVRLRVEGAHYRQAGARCLNYRLDIELWAGWPTVRLDYHYFNLEPGQPSQTIRKIALESAWNLGPAPRRHFIQQNHGLFYVSRHVLNPDPVAIAADFDYAAPHVEEPAMLLDEVDYPFYLNPPLVATQDWLGVGDGSHAVYARMEDFCAAKPNRLTSAANRLAVEVWPETAEPLDLPQGRSRRQTLTLAFVAGETGEAGAAKLSNAPVQAPRGVAALLKAPVHEGRACVSPAWIARCGEFEQDRVLPVGHHIRIEANLAALMRLDMPCTKFDVGDTESHYNGIYAQTSAARVPTLAGAPDVPRAFPRSLPTQTYLDCHEPVWTNNEYDVIHAFCGELMRTGRIELWNTLRLAARHNIEVDFLHYSDHKWLHRATPAHSVRHTTTGAYPSHFWSEGLLEYYCLTGDIDALEVAEALGDKTIENLTDPELRPLQWGFNREIGWSVLTLACLVDVTGEARFKPLLDEMVDYLAAFDRGGYQGGINLSNGNDRQSLNRQIVGNFFGYQSMVDGVDKYVATTGRPEVAAWLERFCREIADAALEAARYDGQLPGTLFGLLLSVGYERTGDTRFLDQMGLLLDQIYWNHHGVSGGASVKPVASIYRGFTRMLGHAQRHGLLDAYEFPHARMFTREPEGMGCPPAGECPLLRKGRKPDEILQ